MPYPPGHLLFFTFCTFLAGVLGIAVMRFKGKVVQLSDTKHLGLLFAAGSLGSLFPDVPALWNFFLHGNLKHVTIGPIPTHSLFFGLTVFFLAMAMGYLTYREHTKAMSVALFAGAGFASHLMLDDLAAGSIYYLYPFHTEPFSVFYSFFI
ncbi:metal-dependent hydrolase [Methanolobus chelungpuianus]|uniref:metal-dependent hydrolase n=1 Tax=Methanolobus chelungpuianus TaxID=502115 RepID=UPI0021140E56|nr:metal-dependent hydrolase [Methanolobus chelungpuianus]